jgi:hypothetical protein
MLSMDLVERSCVVVCEAAGDGEPSHEKGDVVTIVTYRVTIPATFDTLVSPSTRLTLEL